MPRALTTRHCKVLRKLSDLTYTTDTVISTYSRNTNGSMIIKEGVEFQYSSNRIESIHTRLTVTGAWFKSTYHNSQPVYRRPSARLNGKERQQIGLSTWTTTGTLPGSIQHRNFMFDTYLQKLGLNFATSVQCMWFSAQESMRKNGVPIKYVDIKGEEHDYTAADQADMERQHLVVNYNEAAFKRTTVPVSININFSATKYFNQKIGLSLFVNNILDCYNPRLRGRRGKGQKKSDPLLRDGIRLRRHIQKSRI